MIDEHETRSASGMRLTCEQRRAVRNGATLPFSIIVGGAGTGKTACLAALHHVVDSLNGRPGGVLQMALAGRAAKRMREATGRDAVTIAGFLHTMKEEGLASVTHVVIDEASMLDVPGFHAVLRRLKGRASLVLVGDDFQLPPIGGGKILHLLAHRDDIPVTVLDRVWRQEEGNSIRTVAASVRAGAAPDLPGYDGRADGVSLIVAEGGGTKPFEVSPHLLIRTDEYLRYDRRDVVNRCQAEIVGYKEPDEVFLSGSTGMALHLDSVTSLGRKAFRRAGIENASPHRLRARFAVRVIEELVEALSQEGAVIGNESLWFETILTKAAEKMGHAHPQSLRPYLTYVLNRRIQTADATKVGRLAAQARQLERQIDTWVERLKGAKELKEAGVLLTAGRNAEAADALRRIADALE